MFMQWSFTLQAVLCFTCSICVFGRCSCSILLYVAEVHVVFYFGCRCSCIFCVLEVFIQCLCFAGVHVICFCFAGAHSIFLCFTGVHAVFLHFRVFMQYSFLLLLQVFMLYVIVVCKCSCHILLFC